MVTFTEKEMGENPKIERVNSRKGGKPKANIDKKNLRHEKKLMTKIRRSMSLSHTHTSLCSFMHF
jgi:hypothetical protein